MPTLPPLVLAALATALFNYLLELTEEVNPAGSPWGGLLLAGYAMALLPLLRGSRTPNASLPRGVPQPIAVAVLLGGALLATGLLLQRGTFRMATEPVVPARGAQLGLVAQVLGRVAGSEAPVALYAEGLQRAGFVQANQFPFGALLPFWMARAAGYEWRWASLMGVLLLGAGVAGVALWLLRRSGPPGDECLTAQSAALAAVLCGTGFLLFPSLPIFLNWGHTAPLWPQVLLLGLSLAGGHSIAAALLAGLLAAQNPGWLVVLPLVLAAAAQTPRRLLAASVLGGLPPLLAYTTFHQESRALVEGIFRTVFEARPPTPEVAWRYPSVHALGDFLGWRPALYAVGVGLVVWLTGRVARETDPTRRLELLAVGVLVVVAFGPSTAPFHWLTFAAFLTGLLPGAHPWRAPARAPSPALEVTFAAGCAAGFALLAHGLLVDRLDAGAVPRPPAFALPANQTARSQDGFHWVGPDHTWGKDRDVAVSFALVTPRDGDLFLRLGTLGGDFTPFNRTTIHVNGAWKGFYEELPGNFSFSRIPLSATDLHTGLNVVELRAAWTRSPASVNLGTDPAPVSIAYQGLRFLPRGEPPAHGAP